MVMEVDQDSHPIKASVKSVHMSLALQHLSSTKHKLEELCPRLNQVQAHPPLVDLRTHMKIALNVARNHTASAAV